MTSAWDQLEQMLTCPICLDKFKNPRLLPCQHSFCGDACMEGLVDYGRRQIKCPECRAEHRIPYQGTTSLPSNVTLIRFLELHARITGEEAEPVPTFMEKCSVCGEKIEGVQRCSHCDKKVCPECKEAHIDLLRREITRLNAQSKRCLCKMEDFNNDTLNKCEQRLEQNCRDVIRDIEEAYGKLIGALQVKQRKLTDEVRLYTEQEQKTIDKLRVAIRDELSTQKSNLQFADEKLISSNETKQFQWTDQELQEMKEIYTRTMEFVRSFDPEVGDFSRKIRFTSSADVDLLKKRITGGDLGELKLGESAMSQIASSLQCCSMATGKVALEFCGLNAGSQAALQGANSSGYSLTHSNSNSNLNLDSANRTGNALARSQSDHRLASQLHQERDKRSYLKRLLQQQQQQQEAESDSDTAAIFQFKSAFMRRREKERLQNNLPGSYQDQSGDEDSSSETLYDTVGNQTRSVRFCDPPEDAESARQEKAAKLFDSKELELAPLSGVPKLEDSAHLQMRLHQMVARYAVDKRHTEEEGKRDKDLIDSSRLAMSKVVEKAAAYQQNQLEDEIEKQKRSNKQPEVQVNSELRANTNENQYSSVTNTSPRYKTNTTSQLPSTLASSTTIDDYSTIGENVRSTNPPAATNPSQFSTTANTTTNGGSRRGLYGQAMSERSRMQLSSVLQAGVASSSRRPRVNHNTDYTDSEADISSSSLARISSIRPLEEDTANRSESPKPSGIARLTQRAGDRIDAAYSSRFGRARAADTTNEDDSETNMRKISTYSRNSNSSNSQQTADLSDNSDKDSDNENRLNEGRSSISVISKLLDRSAQIRRDSKEQRNRGDSPAQRSSSRINYSSAGSGSRDYTTRTSNHSPATTSSIPSATRRRLTYQRSHSNSTDTNGEQHSESFDTTDDRKGRDISGDSTIPTNRYLSRSRTSAALSGSTGSYNNNASQDASRKEAEKTLTQRSYLNSRDRFAKASAIPTSPAKPESSSNLFGRGATTTTTTTASVPYSINGNLGRFRHQLASPAHKDNNSPFLDLDDEDDDQYSAYGVSAHK